MATELNFSGATPFSHFVPLWLAIERAAVRYSVCVMFCKLHVEYTTRIFNLSSASVGIFVDSDNASLSFGYRHRVAFSLVLNASISVFWMFWNLKCFFHQRTVLSLEAPVSYAFINPRWSSTALWFSRSKNLTIGRLQPLLKDDLSFDIISSRINSTSFHSRSRF